MPFSQGLRNTPILNHFVPPKIYKYDGKGDPAKHINSFKNHMSLRDSSPAIKYRAFHLTLSGAADGILESDKKVLEASKISKWLSLSASQLAKKVTCLYNVSRTLDSSQENH